MPDMNGLLDFVQTPAGQGLLAAAFGAAATAGRGGPVNTLGAAGLSGIAGYSAASANALKQQKAQMLQQQRQAIPTLYGKGADGGDTFDWKSAAALGLAPDEIAKFAQLPRAGMSKVARTVDIPSADGGKQTMQYDEYGQPVGQAIDSYVAPQLVDTGAAKQFAIPKAGQSFAMGMSPGESAANARGWAGIVNQHQQNATMQDANNVQREAGRIQIITGPDGNSYRVDKGTGQVSPIVTQTGTPFQDGASSRLTEFEGKSTLYLSQMTGAENVLDKLARAATPARVALARSPYTNALASGEAQQIAQAQEQWAEGFLRAKTGAASTPSEKAENLRTFFPVVGDSDAVIAQKKRAREQAVIDMRIPAGRGAEQAAQRTAQPQAPMAAPQAGAFADPDKEARYQEFKRRQGQ
ncbi:hypothetical protein KVG88_06305 [Pseudomonas sp. SWRI74]|uniref:Uncharacterized protein n=1 Tax=Pseudomonas azerbaijanoccidentalis TaxID=2842347 RepID=A0ABS6QL62_9PSED|nr:hypothetical protein [Pseudomonas azerbaijanoccidentalis]MBV4519669.1 hypothetical protein [Pseudomonas azerbaijanoccidentalis]